MSRETSEWLNRNTLVGFGRKAWHFANGDAIASQMNHFDGPVPELSVRSLLDSADPVATPLTIVHAGGMLDVPGKAAIVRKDGTAVYAVMSDGYAVHPHGELLNGMETILASDALGIASAGLLENGAVGWVSVSLADSATTVSGVEFVTYLLGYGSHNGRHATSWKLVNQLVVCDNTLDVARGESSARFKVRHTSNSLARLPEAREALGIILAERDETDRAIMELCETSVTDAQFWRMVDVLAPAPAGDATGRSATMAQNKRDALVTLYRSDYRVAPWNGTAFGVLQAVNTYGHWLATGTGTGVPAARNMARVMSGDASKLDAYALDVINGVLSNA